MGVINLKTGSLETQEILTISARTFSGFVQQLLLVIQDHIYLILDNARWYRARGLSGFFISLRYRLTWLFLPPYSLNFNPIERVWRIMRRKATYNRYFGALSELRSVQVTQFIY